MDPKNEKAGKSPLIQQTKNLDGMGIAFSRTQAGTLALNTPKDFEID